MQAQLTLLLYSISQRMGMSGNPKAVNYIYNDCKVVAPPWTKWQQAQYQLLGSQSRTTSPYMVLQCNDAPFRPASKSSHQWHTSNNPKFQISHYNSKKNSSANVNNAFDNWFCLLVMSPNDFVSFFSYSKVNFSEDVAI